MYPRPPSLSGVCIKDGDVVRCVTVFYAFARLSVRNDKCALGGPSQQARPHPEAARSARRSFPARPGIASICGHGSFSLRLCSDAVFARLLFVVLR